MKYHKSDKIEKRIL